MYKLTSAGRRAVKSYLAELAAKRKEILDAGKDTADDTMLPTEQAIVDDIELIGIEDGEYYNSWGVTDNYDADYPLSLQLGEDFVEASTSIKCASTPSVPYPLVSTAALIREFGRPEYTSEGHRLLTDIADTLYNVGIGPDDMEEVYKNLYYQYGKEYWDMVLSDMRAIDSQLTSQAKEDELLADYEEWLADYNDRIGIIASTDSITCATTTRYREFDDIVDSNGNPIAVKYDSRMGIARVHAPVTASAWVAPNGKKYGKQTRRFPSGYLFTRRELRDMVDCGIAEDLAGTFNPMAMDYDVIGFSWNETNGHKSGILIQDRDSGELFVGNTADAGVARW